jgi:hypothetical protein
MKKFLTLAWRVRSSRRLFGSVLVTLAMLTLAIAFWMTGASVAQGEDKCTICHCPPGNPNNCHTLDVGCSAVDAHLRNHPGDCLGPCPCQPTPKQNP